MIDLLFLQIVGGVFLLLYAIRLTGQGFGLAFSSSFDKAWSSAGGSRARAFAAGFAGTALLQSSGAMVTLLISFAHVATLPLARSLGIVLGADLGSTLTVQVLSFRVYQYAFPVLSVGVFLFLWGRKGKVRAIGQGILGFGFMLLALRFLSEAAGDAGRIGGLRIFMAELQDSPLTGFVLGVFLSALFQSGTAVLILLIAFAKEGILSAPTVLPLVLGANVGGTAVAFVARARRTSSCAIARSIASTAAGGAAGDRGRAPVRVGAYFLLASLTTSLMSPTAFCAWPSTCFLMPLSRCSVLPITLPVVSCTLPAASLSVPLT